MMYVKWYIFYSLGACMARGASTSKESLPAAEARRRLPSLVKAMAGKKKASRNLLDDAVEIGPHRKGGAILIPEVDVKAHERQTEALKARVDELEDALEDVGLLLFVQRRLAQTSGRRLSAGEFLAGIGMEEFGDELPRA
jgi:hypothetical protein